MIARGRKQSQCCKLSYQSDSGWEERDRRETEHDKVCLG